MFDVPKVASKMYSVHAHANALYRANLDANEHLCRPCSLCYHTPELQSTITK